MNDDINTSKSAYVQDDNFYGKKTQAVPKPAPNIGVDYEKHVYDAIIANGVASTLDISLLNSFTNISQSRDTIYSLLDAMSEDPTISAVLEIYAEDATEETEDGRIVYCQSDNTDVYKYVTFLLDSMNIDKHIYSWAYSLIKYGDLYVRMYRNSDIAEKDYEKIEDTEQKFGKKNLNEDVKLIAYQNSDRYSHYVEAWPNPAEIFELTRFGKSYAYIQAPVATPVKENNLINSYYQYSFKKNDVLFYDATSFVHACLLDNSTRTPEEVQIFKDDTTSDDAAEKFIVRRGQSVLYNSFKIWREMMLLENAMLLNRITKSSIAKN